jgi:hypothetical protein
MDADVSKTVLDAVFESGHLLDGAVAQLAKGASAEELDRYRDVISRLLLTMLVEIINPILAEHPALTPDEMKRDRNG